MPTHLRHAKFKEMVMVRDLPIQPLQYEMERNAYNNAFHELDFNWHWDSETYDALLRKGSNAAERIRHYLETHQSHLLKAYDANFLVNVIQERSELNVKSAAGSGAADLTIADWATKRVGELRA